ncbi:hypothetical protein ACKLNO_09145 [Neisseriaceae bacterium B1]
MLKYWVGEDHATDLRVCRIFRQPETVIPSPSFMDSSFIFQAA